MYKSELEKLYPARSECIEPAFQHMLGVMGMRYLKAREIGDRDLMIEAAMDLWGMIDLINLQTIFLSTCTHASIAASNEMIRIGRLIRKDLGIDVIGDAVKEKKFDVVSLCPEKYQNWYNIEN
jgi:hypothetical protein